MMFHRVYAISLAVLVLLANVGVPVFSHVCNGRGKVWRSIGVKARSCCSGAIKGPGCYKKSGQSETGIRKKSCCENHFQFVKAPISQYTSIAAQDLGNLLSLAAAVLPTIFHIESHSFLPDQRQAFWPHAPPLIYSGRTLLLNKGVLRI